MYESSSQPKEGDVRVFAQAGKICHQAESEDQTLHLHLNYTRLWTSPCPKVEIESRCG